MNIKKGDKVVVLSGKDKGKKEKVLFVSPKVSKVSVENVMIMTKHKKATQKTRGEIIKKPMLISVSKVMLICPICEKPTRIAYQETNQKKSACL